MDRVNGPSRAKVTAQSAQQLHECPGGPHGAIEQALADVLGQLGLTGTAVAVAPVGCALVLFETLDVDVVTVPPGRGPAVAAGLKRSQAGATVFCYQGGWDAGSAGTSEILHAAAANSPITIVFANRGRIPPTAERGPEQAVDLCHLVAAAAPRAFVTRVVVSSEEDQPALREALTRAFEAQRDGQGFGLVEITSRELAAALGRRPGCPREVA